jgi:hypothetical protein
MSTNAIQEIPKIEEKSRIRANQTRPTTGFAEWA